MTRYLLVELDKSVTDTTCDGCDYLYPQEPDPVCHITSETLGRDPETLYTLRSETCRMWERMPGRPHLPRYTRDPDHDCTFYTQLGTVSRICAGDGHYMCRECTRLSAEEQSKGLGQ